MHLYGKTYWYMYYPDHFSKSLHSLYSYAPLVMNCDRCSVFLFQIIRQVSSWFFSSAASKFYFIDMCLKCLCIIFFLWAFPSLVFFLFYIFTDIDDLLLCWHFVFAVHRKTNAFFNFLIDWTLTMVCLIYDFWCYPVSLFC